MEKQILDYVLVPLGLILMVAYHIWLLRQIIHRPVTTVIGINAINRRFWVRAMMQDTPKNGILAVQSLRNNIMASTLLASTAIMLSSIIAVMMTGNGIGNHPSVLVYGDRSGLGISIKFFSILICFLLAFLLNVQSIRYYSHASILINVPTIDSGKIVNLENHNNDDNNYYGSCVTAEYVGSILNRGSYFWSLGLRAFYFSFPLFLWIFGPIPMFLCSLVLVFFLYFLDVTFDFGRIISASKQKEGTGIREEEGRV